MRAKLVLLALAPAAICAPAFATTYLTVPQAQALMFPGATLQEDFRTLTPAQVTAIQRDSGVNVLTRELHAWRAPSGGWFIADQVVGKHEFITIALALDASGAVRDLEILDYRESYGGEVRGEAWRHQFVGLSHGHGPVLDREIRNISGASLSSRHVTDGVRRLLATYAIVLAP